MKRITHHRLSLGFVFAMVLGAGAVATAMAASTPTPTPNSAAVVTRVFNDCPTSTLTTVNNYPSQISFDDQNVDCFGFANLHVWRFSVDGTNPILFENNSSFRFSADFKIEGTGHGEGGLQISPWWSPNADGLFNVRSTDGEIACFGGRLPFYSFTGAHGLNYVKGTVIRLGMVYEPRALNAGRPATITYTVRYNNVDYTSGPLNFDQGNPAEDPPHGQWGMLTTAQAGGHFKAFLGNGSSVGAKATFSDIEWGTTPIANGAFTKERVFNDCPTSTVVTTNNYPSLISFEDQNVDCFGYANLHIWRFSENGGMDPAIFNNNAQFRFSADFKIEGSGNGEGGLQVSPWWSKEVDGTFNVRTPDGEVAVFGGRLPFYSFTAQHGVVYVKGTVIRLQVAYSPNGRDAGSPATVDYTVNYNGNEYSSGPLPYDSANPAEDPPYGAYGMLNDGQAGGYFKAFLGNGSAVTAKATFSNIRYSTCDAPLAAQMFVWPFVIRAHSWLPYVTVIIDPPSPYHASDIDVSSLTLNGVPASGGGKAWFWNQLLKVKFDRAALVATLPVNQWAPVVLSGKVGGECFEAVKQVKVKGTKFHHPVANSVLTAGNQVDVQWETPEDVQAPTVTLLSTFDEGATWNVEATNVPNNGTYRWTVPNVQSTHARLQVSLMVEEDETGPVNEVDVAESDDFVVLASPLDVVSGNAEFALRGAVPNPSRGLNVSFSLPNGAPATLAVYDVTGRQVSVRDVGALGAGRHTVSIAPAGRLPIGVYMIQLNQGARKLNSRAVIIE